MEEFINSSFTSPTDLTEGVTVNGFKDLYSVNEFGFGFAVLTNYMNGSDVILPGLNISGQYTCTSTGASSNTSFFIRVRRMFIMGFSCTAY